MKNVAGFDLVRLMVGSRASLGVITSVSLRVFPRPARDALLVVRGASPEELLPAARAVATAPLVPAAAVLVAPEPAPQPGPESTPEAAQQPAPVPGSGTGSERGSPGADEDPAAAALVVRLHGAAAAVAADRARLEARVGSTFQEVPPGVAARYAAAVRDHAADGEVVVRASAYPAELGRVVELLRRDAGWTALSADPLSGRVRAVLPAPEGEALLALRADVGALGGSLILARAPADLARRTGVRGPALPDEGIAVALRRRFDPHDTLHGAFS